MQKLSDCSKSTKVPAGQISLWISSRVTTSPGRPASSSSTLSGWGWSRTVVPLRRSSPLRTSSSKGPKRSASSRPSGDSFNELDARCTRSPSSARLRLVWLRRRKARSRSLVSSIFCGLGLLVGSPCLAADDPLERARAILARHPVDRRAQRPAVGHPRERRRRLGTWWPTTCAAAPRATPTSSACARAASAGSSGRSTCPYESRRRGHAARADRHRPAHRRPLPGAARVRRDAPTRSSARCARDASRRSSAWRAATRSRTRSGRCAPSTPRRPLHDAHALEDARLGRLRHRRGAPRRPHAASARRWCAR